MVILRKLAWMLLTLPLLAGCGHKGADGSIGPTLTGAISSAPEFLDQGSSWTAAKRLAFYSQDQGSQLIPLAWLKALKTSDGKPFLDDQLARYGYLPNPQSPNGLPVGFTVSNHGGVTQAGLSCAACHTRQIMVDSNEYRIDGGPAISDFQSLLVDLVTAVGRIRSSDTDFNGFADTVLGAGSEPAKRAALHQAVELWYTRESAMMAGALPKPDMWGLGRLDAVSMIFNRLSGLDIGRPPSHLITANIQLADAPVRYPFVWNAPIQDKTQWPGFADNGDSLLGLARNAGEVYGVFATFHPERKPLFPNGVDFRKSNSANFGGLARLEDLISAIGAPKYPWPIDAGLAKKGEGIFTSQCAGCHGVTPGKPRLFNLHTWHTPIQDVGTDSKQYSILGRTAASGALEGGHLTIFNKPIPKNAKVIDLLGFSVIGSILQGGLLEAAQHSSTTKALPPAQAPKVQTVLKGAYSLERTPDQIKMCDPKVRPYCYESRVLHGIWATAPYLHNGSVPTLEDLLKPSGQRPVTFKIGRAYDIKRLGLASEQPGSPYTRTTTDCSKRAEGNSRCGHEGPGFGTDLSDADRSALLEYLKTL